MGGSYKQQLHDLNLTIENLKTELHHSHRGSGRIQQEYEKIKHQLEKERDECNLTIRELRKANEKYQIEIELKNEKIQSIVNSGNHQIETHQRHQEVDQERQKFEDAANQAIENLKALLEQEKS